MKQYLSLFVVVKVLAMVMLGWRRGVNNLITEYY